MTKSSKLCYKKGTNEVSPQMCAFRDIYEQNKVIWMLQNYGNKSTDKVRATILVLKPVR